MLDPGSKGHLCPDRQAFSSLRPARVQAVVGVGEGRSPILGVGEVQLLVPRRDGKLLSLLLPEVLWFPGTPSCIISMHSRTGCSCH